VEKGILDVFGQFQDGRENGISSRNDNGLAVEGEERRWLQRQRQPKPRPTGSNYWPTV
jgi:hypothetical protein